MDRKQAIDIRTVLGAACICGVGLFASCGGDTGNERDSGTEKTTLSVAATDPDGDTLIYQWRVTAGTIDNRNASQTVWTLPSGPGLHFAYVLVSDGRGGYAEQQYAVSSDALDTQAPTRAAVAYPIAAIAPKDPDGTAVRLRLSRTFSFADASSSGQRDVYLPDVAVRVSSPASGVLFSGTTDVNGEVNLPQLLPSPDYTVECSTTPGTPLAACAGAETKLGVSADGSSVRSVTPSVAAANNLQLHGHVSLGDEGVCGTQNEYFNIQTSATVQLLQGNGQALGAPRRVNRFGDYWIQAAVSVDDPLTIRIECGAERKDFVLNPAADADLRNKLMNSLAIEQSHRFTNRRPSISRMIANGPEGNLRGRMVIEEPGAPSNTQSGATRFLSYKGTDTARSACMYYRSIDAVSACDTQGGMSGAISFDDWKKKNQFAPYLQGNTEVAGTYVNQRDLNLVRRMVATQAAANNVAFYVCNNPGPEGRSQAEVDEVIGFGLADERRVACVAMEWSVTAGVNMEWSDAAGAYIAKPFTKFLTFGPDGSLIPSVNLDGRGEKYMPGACIACHGASKVGGRFPETGNPSPLLGARFLPFDTGNFVFSTRSELTEASQGAAFRKLNDYVVATEGGPSAGTPTTKLVAGWYSSNPNQLDKSFVPVAPAGEPSWHVTVEKATFYREVIGTSCRTCHTALGSKFDWDGHPERFGPDAQTVDATVKQHVCGGTKDLALNASMPNALVSLNRLLVDNPVDGELRRRMEKYLGCQVPDKDPVYPLR